MEFVYYRSVQGRAVSRYGTQAFIGARRSPEGFVWNTAAVAIPLNEYTQFVREYRQHEAAGDLVRLDGPDPVQPAGPDPVLDSAAEVGASLEADTPARPRRPRRT